MQKNKGLNYRQTSSWSENASGRSVSTSKFYRQYILETSRSLKYRGKIKESDLELGERIVKLGGSNSSCGDQLTVYLKIGRSSGEDKLQDDAEDSSSTEILDAKFEGSGCAISMASAHFLCENVIGKTTDEVQKYVAGYLESIDAGMPDSAYAPLDNVVQMPARVKCARLAWGTVIKSLENDKKISQTVSF